MKKALAVLLSVLMLATLIVPTLAYAKEADVVLKLTADKTEVKRGESVTVTVTATKNVGWLMFIAKASFDSGAFAQDGNVAYGSVGTGTKGTNATIDAGSEDTTETGVYFSYTLSVLDNAPYGEYTVGLKEFDVSNIDEDTVTVEADTVTVKVVCPHEGTGRVDGNVVAATCATKGSKEIKCAECGAVLETQVLDLDPNNHEGPFTDVAGVDSTCHTPGHAAYTYCEACSAVTEGSSEDLPLDLTNHTGEGETIIPEVPATCSAPGTEAATACAGCGTILSGGETIQQLAHEWSSVTYTWSADKTTCTASRTCSVGNETETEKVTASPSVVEKADCLHPGVTKYTATFENKAFEQQVAFNEATPAALGHAWGDAQYVWDTEAGEVMATHVCTRDPHHSEMAFAKIVKTVTKAPTTEEEGEYTLTANFENTPFETQTKTGTIDKLAAYELEEKAIDYTVGTDKDATITVKEAEGDFMPETLAITDKDGNPVEVTDADYTYENGKFTLKESFASKLAAGTYKVTFQVGEKGVLANVEVKAAHSTATGDTAASLIVWSFVALVSLAGAVVMTKKIRASK